MSEHNVPRMSPDTPIERIFKEVMRRDMTMLERTYFHLKPVSCPIPVAVSKSFFRHEVQFYSDSTVLLDRLAPFVRGALTSGDLAIVIARESHRIGLAQRLTAEGFDVDAAIKARTYIPVDAVRTLPKIMVRGRPDPSRFLALVDDLIMQGTKTGGTGQRRVVAFGEWVSLLSEDDQPEAALLLEQLWNRLAKMYEVDILCGYASSCLNSSENGEVLANICAEHSAVYFEANTSQAGLA